MTAGGSSGFVAEGLRHVGRRLDFCGGKVDVIDDKVEGLKAGQHPDAGRLMALAGCVPGGDAWAEHLAQRIGVPQ